MTNGETLLVLLRSLLCDSMKLAKFCDQPDFPFDYIRRDSLNILEHARSMYCDFSAEFEEMDRYVRKSCEDKEPEFRSEKQDSEFVS